MKRPVLLLLFLPLCLGLCSCKERMYVFTPPAESGEGPKAEYTVYDTGIEGLSGLCFNRQKDALLAVSDHGVICELNFNGTTKRILPYSGKNDFEAITINPADGTIYLADEGEMTVWQLSADEKSLTKVIKIDDIPNPVSNKGLEGVTYGSGALYITNQTSPTRLIGYSLATGQHTNKDLSFATFFSDICYDATDNSLWIVDSKQQTVFHCTTDGVVKASQSIPFVDKAEALCVDRPAGHMWIGSDATGKLYKVKLTI